MSRLRFRLLVAACGILVAAGAFFFAGETALTGAMVGLVWAAVYLALIARYRVAGWRARRPEEDEPAAGRCEVGCLLFAMLVALLFFYAVFWLISR